MAQTAPSVDAPWTTFRSWSKASRDRFLARVVADAEVRQELEDALDLATVHDRTSEPTRPLNDVLDELDPA